jgi:hypothetical protein
MPQISIQGLGNPNIDWLVAVGTILPPSLGLLLLASKPQTSIGLIIYWIILAWQTHGYKSVIRLVAPVSIGFAFSFLLYGLYFTRFGGLLGLNHNVSLWPYGLPIGIILIVLSIRRSQPGLALAASPFLAPYITWYGWVFLPFGLLPNNKMATSVSLVLSAFYLIHLFFTIK